MALLSSVEILLAFILPIIAIVFTTDVRVRYLLGNIYVRKEALGTLASLDENFNEFFETLWKNAAPHHSMLGISILILGTVPYLSFFAIEFYYDFSNLVFIGTLTVVASTVLLSSVYIIGKTKFKNLYPSVQRRHLNRYLTLPKNEYKEKIKGLGNPYPSPEPARFYIAHWMIESVLTLWFMPILLGSLIVLIFWTEAALNFQALVQTLVIAVISLSFFLFYRRISVLKTIQMDDLFYANFLEKSDVEVKIKLLVSVSGRTGSMQSIVCKVIGIGRRLEIEDEEGYRFLVKWKNVDEIGVSNEVHRGSEA